MNKVAVVLFNLGGPDSKEAIEPFLFNFFTDPNIITLPNPFRWMLAKQISKKRSKKEARESYGALGDQSPLLENTNAQAAALEEILNLDGGEFKVFTCMRYWHPMAEEIAKNVEKWGAEKIVLVPLYPQFSTTTTGSSLEAWNKAIQNTGLEKIPVSSICCYSFNDGFIKASVNNIKAQYQRAIEDGHENIRILFSAHGLPEKTIKGGDPYQWQCEQSVEKIVAALNIEKIDWTICYQSKVGRLKWIGPSLDEELGRAAKAGMAVVIYPHSFTQEHIETLVELDVEYRHIAEEIGVSGYYRAQTVGTHPVFIEGLAHLVIGHLDQNELSAEGGVRICPDSFNRCCMENAHG